MKKIIKILIPHREGLETKWWHRLINVLIVCSTLITVLISALVLSDFSKDKYFLTKNLSFSFEDNYSSIKGKEVDCNYNYESPVMAWGFCDDTSINSGDLIRRFNTQIRSKVDENYLQNICPKEQNTEQSKKTLTNKEILCFRIHYDLAPMTTEIFEGIDSEFTNNKDYDLLRVQELKMMGLKAKQESNIIISNVLKDIGIIILITISWLVFWESIFYRALLYIIFGNKK